MVSFLDQSSLIFASETFNNLVAVGKTVLLPRLVGEAEPPKLAAIPVWAAARQLADVLDDQAPLEAFSVQELATALGLPDSIDAEWWGAEALIGLALAQVPPPIALLGVLNSMAPAVTPVAIDRLSFMRHDQPE